MKHDKDVPCVPSNSQRLL